MGQKGITFFNLTDISKALKHLLKTDSAGCARFSTFGETWCYNSMHDNIQTILCFIHVPACPQGFLDTLGMDLGPVRHHVIRENCADQYLLLLHSTSSLWKALSMCTEVSDICRTQSKGDSGPQSPLPWNTSLVGTSSVMSLVLWKGNDPTASGPLSPPYPKRLGWSNRTRSQGTPGTLP